MFVIVIILLVAIVAVLSISFALGLFRIEKIEVEQEEPDFVLPELESELEEALPEEPVPEEEKPFIDLDDGLSLKEKMDLTAAAAVQEHEPEPSAIFEALEEDVYYEYDRLTEFKSGRGFWLDCQKKMAQAKEQGMLYAAASFDIDRFRFINSLKGMSIGDYVLTRLSQELPGAFPEGTEITRISADHFAAFFPLSSMDMIEIVVGHIVDICEKIRSDIALKSVLRVCTGVAVSQQDYDAQVLLHKANLARHSIKFSRTENWKLFDDTLVTSYLNHESSLDDYSENQYDDDFLIYFVPQQDLTLHKTNGAETVVRWACEEVDGKTLAATATKGMLPTNSSKIIYQVCKVMSRWRKAGKQVIPVTVNVPVTEFYKEDFADFVGRCLSEFQIEPAELMIVVDASVIRVDWSIANRQLGKLRALGARTGVDNVDLSYQDLDFLTGLPLNCVKLQRTFSADIQKDVERQNAVSRILASAASLGLQVIVEGVDMPEQAETLLDLGVQWAQGQYCGWPGLADEFIHGLSNHVQRITGTVILDDMALHQGEYKIY